MNLSEYLSTVANRDKLMGVMQFLPMMLGGVTSGDTSTALTKLSTLADGYRTVTRFTGLIDMTSEKKLASIANRPAGIPGHLVALDYLADVCFYPCEHVAMLSAYGVLSKNFDRFGGVALFCWFWGLTFKIVLTAMQILATLPYVSPKATDSTSLSYNAKYRKLRLTLVKLACFWFFALGCFPGGGKKPQLLATASGPLYPLHRLVELLSPNGLPLPAAVKGALGLAATLVDFA